MKQANEASFLLKVLNRFLTTLANILKLIKFKQESNFASKIPSFILKILTSKSNFQVDYTADDINGFNAVVTKTGPSVHATKVVAPVHAVAPVVHKQIVAPVAAPVVYKSAPLGK